MWTPYQMKIVLHHHTCHDEFPGKFAPAYGQTVEILTALFILRKEEDGRLTTTEKGKALVDMWLATPMPERKWVDPRFEEANRD